MKTDDASFEALRAELNLRACPIRSVQTPASIQRFSKLPAPSLVDTATNTDTAEETPSVKFHFSEEKKIFWGVDGDEDLARRVLAAKQNHVAQAADMYCALMKWRGENNVDTILNAPDPNEEFYQRTMPHRFHGNDKEGRVVYIERTGPISCRMHDYLKHVSEHDMIVRHIRWQEVCSDRLRLASVQYQKPVSKVVIIFDMTGTSMSVNAGALRIFKAVVNIDSNYYPERLERLFLINANWMFRGIWAVVSPWLDEATRKKIEILGPDYKERLLNLIAPEQLPVEYGGTCACGFDGQGTSESPEACLPPIRKFPPEDQRPPITTGSLTIKGPS